MFINMISIIFWNESLAQVIFITFMASEMLMMGLYARFGFSKILGLGHIFWIPLLAYMVIEMPLTDSLFKSYLMVLSGSIVISLIIDVLDVWQYFKNSIHDDCSV